MGLLADVAGFEDAIAGCHIPKGPKYPTIRYLGFASSSSSSPS